MTADVIPGTCRHYWPTCLAYHRQHCQSWWRGRRPEHKVPRQEAVSKPASNNSLHQSANKVGAEGRWCHASNPSWPVYNACPTLGHHTRVTPETAALLVLRRWCGGVLLVPSRFKKAFIVPALPLLPPRAVTICKQEHYVNNLDLTSPRSCCADRTMSSELKARGCSSHRMHIWAFRDPQRERKYSAISYPQSSSRASKLVGQFNMQRNDQLITQH